MRISLQSYSFLVGTTMLLRTFFRCVLSVVATLLLIYNCSRARDKAFFTDGYSTGVLCWYSAVYGRERQASRVVKHIQSRDACLAYWCGVRTYIAWESNQYSFAGKAI